MKVKEKILVSIIGISTIFLIANPVKSKAALQSNGNSPATKNINGWITEIRKMQATGGTLGLTDEINDTNLTSKNTNLDIHMEKNTEYGAMAILSASSYGNPNIIEDGDTTTGNKTGVYIAINGEWVAAVTNDTVASSFVNASGRYKNIYTTSTDSAKIGDAINTVGAWHGSTNTVWFSCRLQARCNGKAGGNQCGLVRSFGNGVFSYNGYWGGGWRIGYVQDTCGSIWYNGRDFINQTDRYFTKPYAGRAVVVVGSGI